MEIRETTDDDLAAVQAVNRAAFRDEGEVVARMVADVFADATAVPLLSLVALQDGKAVGHALFTAAHVGDDDSEGPVCSLLAPLAVVPEAQGTGVGTALMERGLADLAARGVALVFLAGHPDYYPRFGFEPATPHGFTAPHPIPPQYADAWMVLALQPDVLGTCSGVMRCCKAVDRAELWEP